MATIREAIAKIQATANQPERARTAPPANEFRKVVEQDVLAVEAALGRKLPESYRQLVLNVGFHEMLAASFAFYWVALPSDWWALDIVRTNKAIASPPFLLAVTGFGNGDEKCFDMRRPDSAGEYPLVKWDHEIHDEASDSFEPVAPSLAELLILNLPGPGNVDRL